MRKEYLFILVLSLFSFVVIGQNLQTTFGKNRIQYHDDFEKWWLYETDNFVTHWYGKSRYIGQTVMQMAEYDYYEIQNVLEHRINDKIDIIVYVDETDVKQSNIGDEDAFISTSGKTKVTGNKIFVYFDGNHYNLRKQLREGIAHVYLNAILFGSNLQELVQNTVSLKIPAWFKDGLISYIGSEWSIELDESLRYAFNQKKFKKFDKVSNYYPEQIGHAFWDYIANTYGKSTIANLLYLTRINKNPKKAFLYVIGVPYKQITQECYDYYKNKYREENKLFTQLDPKKSNKSRAKKYQKITTLKFSSNQQYLAYVVNDIGKSKVILHDMDRGSHQTIMVTGFRNIIQSTDQNYPQLAWHHSKPLLMMIYEEKDIIKSKSFNLASGEIIEDVLAPEYQRIYSADYISDEEMILSASTEGYPDLYRYSLKYRTSTRLTKDFFDDLDLEFVQSSKFNGIFFSSNRITTLPNEGEIDTLLPIDQFDIYFLDLTKDSVDIKRITSTYHANERKPYFLEPNQLLLLSDESGVINQQLIDLETNTTNYLTNGNHSLTSHHGSGQRIGRVYKRNNRSYLYLADISETNNVIPTITQYHRFLYPWLMKNDWNTPSINEQQKVTHVIEDTTIYLFQSEFEDPAESVFDQLDLKDYEQSDPSNLNPAGTSLRFKPLEKFQFAKMISSRLKFKFDRFYSNLDNSILFDGLDTYAGNKRGFEYPPMGILLKASINDLFEDYEFEGGVRIPTSFNGSEYFLIFDNKKKRIDKRYALYRKSTLGDDNESETRIHNLSFIGLTQWRYPLDVYTSIRAQATLRLDKQIRLASDINSLQSIDVDEQRLGLKLEYVFDNTVDVDLNIKTGSRYKVSLEAVKKMNVQLFDPWTFNFDEGFMSVIGLDARHYQKLDRHSIFAARLSAATSFGSEQIVYFMGGVNNWLFPQYNEQIPIPPSDSYAYNGLAANMRGFKQNIRNGTSYALLNTELRVPVFKYFFERNLHSAFLRNFQLTGFFDVGTAWHGSSPFSKDNPLNIISVSNPLVTIDINYSREPVIYGYGAGIRLYLLGYLIKADYAWGVESGLSLKPRLYISLGTDF